MLLDICVFILFGDKQAHTVVWFTVLCINVGYIFIDRCVNSFFVCVMGILQNSSKTEVVRSV